MCFHNRHALNDNLTQRSKSDVGGAGPGSRILKSTKLHRWAALVQPCALCGRYAARWRCTPCQQCYCATCYSRVHSRGACMAHSCDRLGYYTVKMHSRDERAFRAKAWLVGEHSKIESVHAARPLVRSRAALTIQCSRRAALCRAAGQAQLHEQRKRSRRTQQRRLVDSLVKSGRIFVAVWPFGAISTKDDKECQVLQRLAHWKRLAVQLGQVSLSVSLLGAHVQNISSCKISRMFAGKWRTFQQI